ncbi:hypothetical protein BaRGS_00004485 [Batillaria attramentaria]|uniref:Sulfatase N-terminal domain-containing protein n=1 Tax=Batillaria attramentaria TaxID=370345 RepID=A0ABD0LYG6_9CAEN
MSMKTFICVGITMLAVAMAADESPPNLLLFVTDDLGYGDLGCFGNTTIRTPNIDKLATEGVKLTHSTAAESLCTPSRAAFLTGRYPIRSGMTISGQLRVIVYTASAAGLPANETTFAEVAKSAGYTTALLGKWHLGWSLDRSDPEHCHPLNQGFDYFYGVPLSNMPDFEDGGDKVFVQRIPQTVFQTQVTFVILLLSVICLTRAQFLSLWCGVVVILVFLVIFGYMLFPMFNLKLLNSFMYRNYDLVEQPIHLPSITSKLVMESQQFLQARHADNTPFLLVVSWLHVHTALVTAPQFRGRSQHGPYGDAVEEMDWGVGQVLNTLDRLGLAHNTLVYFTSDHGGDSEGKDGMGRPNGGYNGPFRGAKMESSPEGAIRVPGIVRWPGKVPAGHVIQEPVSLMDMLPTIASLLHAPLPSGVTLDGKDLVPLLTGQTSVSPHEFLFHYCGDRVHAVRYRPRTGTVVWKLLLRDPPPSVDCSTARHLDPPQLIDLTSDPGEASPLDLDLKEHQEAMATMMAALREHERGVVHVPSQLTLTKSLWLPWKQPCCQFPACVCQDDKFRGMFDDW